MLQSYQSNSGDEKIPKVLLDIAKGVVFFTIIKVKRIIA
jgi:lipid-binding SYLF domain-containing protein